MILTYNVSLVNRYEKAKEKVEEKRILLMDGEELELIIEQFMPLDKLLKTKQLYYFWERNPFYKVKKEDLIKKVVA